MELFKPIKESLDNALSKLLPGMTSKQKFGLGIFAILASSLVGSACYIVNTCSPDDDKQCNSLLEQNESNVIIDDNGLN